MSRPLNGRVEEYPGGNPIGDTLVRAISTGLTFARPMITSRRAVHFLNFNMRHVIPDGSPVFGGKFSSSCGQRAAGRHAAILDVFHYISGEPRSTLPQISLPIATSIPARLL